MTWPSNSSEATSVGQSAKKFQFRIRDLFVVTVLVALFYGGLFEQNVWLLLASLVAGIVCARWLWRLSVLEIAVVLTAIGILIALLLPGLEHPGWAHRRSYCGYNLRNIGIALHAYHDEYKSLPPAYVADENGKPMHSWRVLILPYLVGGPPLYQRYRFDEPWNGPNNRLLAGEIAEFYACPEVPRGKRGESNYLAVVGPGTSWPGEKSTRLQDLKDGMVNVILLVEVHGSGIHCTEPRDLDLATFVPEVNPRRGTGLSSPHPWKKDMRQTIPGAHVLMASGEVRFLGRDCESHVIASQLRGNDGTAFAEEESP